MRKITFVIIIVSFFGCSFENPTEFTEHSLTEKFKTLDKKEVTIGSILSRYKGKKVVIDIWASWCKDCIVGLPKLKNFQQENPDVVYVFLSLDKSIEAWKKAIDMYGLKGEHFFMKEGKKGAFGDFLNLWWVPRYVVLNERGQIALFKATKITDKNIVQALKK